MTNTEPIVKSQNLASLLYNDSTYLVPRYQRDYEWTEEQVSALTADLLEFVTGDDHFYILGQIILAPSPEHPWKYSVVDGQQRLTTLYLLFIALDARLSQYGIPADQSSLEGRARLALKQALYMQGVNNLDLQQRLLPTHLAQKPFEQILNGHELEVVQLNATASRVQKNYDELHSWVATAFSDSEVLANFVQRILFSVYLNTVEVDSEEQALAIFEKINNRGMPLNSAALLRFLLFQEASATDFEAISFNWEQAGIDLFKARPVSIASHQYLMQAMLQPYTGKFVAVKDVHKAWLGLFTNPETRNEFRDVVAFSERIKLAAKTLSVLASPNTNALNRELISARYFSATQHFPVVLVAHELFADKRPELFTAISRAVDARLCLSLFAGEGAQYLYSSMWRWSQELHSLGANATFDEVMSALHNDETHYKALFASAKIKLLSYSYSNTSQRKRIRYAISLIAHQIEIDAEHVSENTSLEKLLDTKSRERFDLDHVFARSLVTNPNFDQSQGIDWVDRIGNLCLLHNRDNNEARAITPEGKSSVYAVSRLLLTATLANQDDAPSLETAQAKASRVVKLLREAGAQRVEGWTAESASRQADFYFDAFERAVRIRLGLE